MMLKKNITITQIFQMSGNEFIYSLFDWVVGAGFNPTNATDSEKALIFVVTAPGILGNGGFRFFYENDFDNGLVSHEEIVSYFDKVGSHGTASILRKSLLPFPEAKPHCDLKLRRVFLDNFFDTEKNDMLDR